jgi:hypothetical protein
MPHGTLTRWLEGCDCDRCREAQNDAARARFRRKAQERLPADVRQQLLDAIYGGQPFRTALGDLSLTPNQVWGLTKTNQEWSEKLEAALTATRRADLDHGTNAAYVVAVSAKSAGPTSASGWQGTAASTDPNVEPRDPTSGYQWEVEPADVLSDRDH